MNYKRNLIIILMIFLSGFFETASNVFAQSESNNKQKSIDFGSSVKRKKDKNKAGENLAGAQLSTDTSSDDVIKVETNFVRTDVLVLDQEGNAVSELKANDFVITENAVPQKIETFSIGQSQEVPRSIVLIIDYSGSQRPYIKNSIQAAKLLIDKLNPKDKMAIVSDDVKLLVPFTQDKKLLKSKLENLLSKAQNGDPGKSQQYTALMASLNELFTEEDTHRIVIFQTDGDQLFQIKHEINASDPSSKKFNTTFTDVELIETIEKSRATIYSVYPGFSLMGLSREEQIKKTLSINEKRYLNYRSMLNNPIEQIANEIYSLQLGMKIIAEVSGGYISLLEKPEDADAIYSAILASIENRYLIGFYPTNQERDGKRRSVKIEVRNHPEYKVLGQKSYIASK